MVDSGKRAPAPVLAPAPLPAGPAADLTKEGIAGQKPGTVGGPPNFLRFSPDMTPLQRRSAISTYGTQGDGRYSDSATRDYYKNLLLSEYTPEKGLPGGVLPSEYQYAENVLGVKPRERTAESLISAILRG